MAVKGLHLLCAVEGVVAVPGLVVRQQVAGVVILEHGGDAALGEGGQPVPGVVLVQFLHAAGDPACAVARLVVEQLLGVGGILHLFQLVQRVIVIEGITSKLTFQRPVAVAVIEIPVLRQQFPAGLDKQTGEILVQVVLELPLDRTVGFRADGAVGVVLIRRQPVPIIPHFGQQIKGRIDELRHFSGHVSLANLVSVAIIGQSQQRPAAGGLADHPVQCVILIGVPHSGGDGALQ